MIISYHSHFWSLHPALLIGVSFLLGIGSTLFGLPLWIPTGWTLYLILLRKGYALTLIPLASIYAWVLLGQHPQLERPTACSAYFSISSLEQHSSPFHKDLIYKGTLYYEHNALPCTVVWKKKERPRANADYLLSGLLIQPGPFDYLFRADEYKAVPNTWSLAESRYQAKQIFSNFLQEKLTRTRTALLLSSLITGQVDDRLLRFEFGRLGLQHLLAVSGFHFGILLVFLSYILGFFLPHTWKWALMLLALTAYLFFVGSSPAGQRAWIVSTLVLAAKIFRRPSTPLNLLGAALFIELALDPLVAAHFGFQLSFACCFGILLFYEPLEKTLRSLLPRRPLGKSLRFSPLSQPLLISSGIFRSTLAITLAVNIAIFPLLFYHFGRFPLLGLLYNLFFPFLISLTLFALMVALILHALVPSLALPLFSAIDWFTAQLLDLITYPPLLLDHSLYCPAFPLFLIPIYLFALLSYAIASRNFLEESTC